MNMNENGHKHTQTREAESVEGGEGSNLSQTASMIAAPPAAIEVAVVVEVATAVVTAVKVNGEKSDFQILKRSDCTVCFIHLGQCHSSDAMIDLVYFPELNVHSHLITLATDLH